MMARSIPKSRKVSNNFLAIVSSKKEPVFYMGFVFFYARKNMRKFYRTTGEETTTRKPNARRHGKKREPPQPRAGSGTALFNGHLQTTFVGVRETKSTQPIFNPNISPGQMILKLKHYQVTFPVILQIFARFTICNSKSRLNDFK